MISSLRGKCPSSGDVDGRCSYPKPLPRERRVAQNDIEIQAATHRQTAPRSCSAPCSAVAASLAGKAESVVMELIWNLNQLLEQIGAEPDL